MAESTGYLTWSYQGEQFTTWYKVVGDLKSVPAPLVTLHGGPGQPLGTETHVVLHEKYHIPIVIYEQVGCGRSTHLRDKTADYFTFELFFTELDALLAHLRIADSFMLLGHSWGGMLSSEYVAMRQPAGLRRLVLVDAPASVERWHHCSRRLLKEGWPDKVDMVVKCEDEGRLDDPEYLKVWEEFFEKHICRVKPWPKLYADSVKALIDDPTLSKAMAGEYKLKPTGTLRDWKGKADKIAVPTLVVSGMHDWGNWEAQQPWFNGILKVKWVPFAHSAHVPFFEEPERYFETVAKFVTDMQ